MADFVLVGPLPVADRLVDLRSQRKGDQFVRVDVEIPKRLSSKEKALFEELARLRGEDHSSQGLKDKIKKAFK